MRRYYPSDLTEVFDSEFGFLPYERDGEGALGQLIDLATVCHKCACSMQNPGTGKGLPCHADL